MPAGSGRGGPTKGGTLSLEDEIDLVALARRVVARLRPAADLRDDLSQQAVAMAIELSRRFTPRDGPDAPPAREQAARYLFVSLQWNLRAYARGLRSVMPTPESDRRLARAYARLTATQGPLTTNEAARQLGVQEKRLAAALAAGDRTVSLDQPGRSDDDGESSLGQRIASAGPGPEDLSLAAAEAATVAARRAAVEGLAGEASPTSARARRRARRRLLYLLLDRMRHGDAEVLRLAYALPRKEMASLRSCRAYGCRRDGGHEHRPGEIARWLQGDAPTLARRLDDCLDRLRDLLGGRDPRSLLGEVSAEEVGKG
ncbi:MAG: hypothetical protein ACRDIY_15300 [Chloroflexota bacterium]